MKQTQVNVLWRQKESFLQQLNTWALLWNVILFICSDETQSAYWYNSVRPVVKNQTFVFLIFSLSFKTGDWFPPGYNIKPSFGITGGLTPPIKRKWRDHSNADKTITCCHLFLTHYTFTTHFSNHSTTYIYTKKTYFHSNFCPSIKAECLSFLIWMVLRSYSNISYEIKVCLWSQFKS